MDTILNLNRNKNIVDASNLIFAFPFDKEIIRSGTWSTIRYAKKINKPLIIIRKDGSKELVNI